jgi:hypothetical protein
VAKSNKERAAEYRLRRKTGESIPLCGCGRPLKGNLSKKRQLCTACYGSSPIYRHLKWVNTNLRRGRELYSESVERYKRYRVGGRAIAPNGSKGIIQSITSWGNGDIVVAVEFEDGDKDVFLLFSKNL